jgi:RHS repeat-associated protein
MRITWEQALIVQENHYYPFGMNLVGIEKRGNPEDKFQYNGKEKQEEFGLNAYDYGARFYSFDAPRWWQIDPLADEPEQIDKSPYAAFWNNPIRYNDPDGKCPECEENIKNPTDGQRYTSTGGEEYIFGNGTWTREGGSLQEVTITAERTQPTDRQVASFMPFQMAFGLGVYGGLQQSGEFLSSLTTAKGWQDLGEGVANLAKMSNLMDAEGMMMRAGVAESVYTYVSNIPDMSAGEVAYDLGYASEKVGEAVLVRKVLPISKSSLGLKKGFGKVTPYTNRVSYDLKGKLGKLPFSVPTLMPKIGRKTSDVGIMLSRNFITPFGYTVGVGQLQYIQKREQNGR